MEAADGLRLHGSVVAMPVSAAWRGLLITGPSGSGKSALALHLMALGARLVGDDQVLIRRRGDRLFASGPDATRGMIEARGVGLLRADPLPEAPLAASVDLGQRETERMPPPRIVMYLDVALPLFHAVHAPYFHAALAQYLRAGLNRGD